MKRANRVWAWWEVASAVVLTGMGVALAVVGARDLRRGEAALEWPVATATVQSAEVARCPDPNDGKTRLWYANVEYVYRVGGRSYRSNRLGLSPVDHGARASTDLSREMSIYGFNDSLLSDDRSRPELWVKQHPAGTAIPVFYDPQNPSLAILDPFSANDTGGPLYVGLGLAIIGLVLSAAALHRKLTLDRDPTGGGPPVVPHHPPGPTRWVVPA